MKLNWLIPILLLLSLPVLAQSTCPAPPTHCVFIPWTAATTGGTVTGYKVKRGLASGGPYVTIASPTIINYADVSSITNPLTDGSKLWYVITATGPGGESGPSNEVLATIPFLPPASVVVSPPIVQ
jgi:hypothetical protein